MHGLGPESGDGAKHVSCQATTAPQKLGLVEGAIPTSAQEVSQAGMQRSPPALTVSHNNVKRRGVWLLPPLILPRVDDNAVRVNHAPPLRHHIHDRNNRITG